MTIETLENIGLLEREAKIYLALLEVGESTVLPIAQKANIKRTYTYDILDALAKKGLVSYVQKNGRRRYIAEDPKHLEHILKERMARFSEVLPELRSIYNHAPSKPKVRFYDGKEGAKQVYEEVLLTAKAYDCVYSPDYFIPIWGEYNTEIAERVVKRGIRARELLMTKQPPVHYAHIFKKPLQEIRYLPEDLRISTDMLILENKLVLVSYVKDVHTVVIEGSGIVDTHQALFDLLWQATPPA